VVNGADAEIDLTAPVSFTAIPGFIDEWQIVPTTVDGTYTLQVTGWDTGTDIAMDSYDDITDIIDNTRGMVTINMEDADYQMTEAESLCGALLVVNTGDGSKTLSVYDSANNPGTYSVLNYVNGNPFTFASADDEVVIFQRARAAYVYGAGMVDLETNPTIVCDGVEVTTAGNTNEQIIKRIILPAGSLARNGDSINIKGFMSKSSTATTETLALRFGSAGTVPAGDTAAWSNASLATTNDFVSFSVDLMRYSATLIRTTSSANSLSPYATNTSSLGDITVANLDTALNYITFTGTNSTGAETVTCKKFEASLRR
jgi:hypothetical protein